MIWTVFGVSALAFVCVLLLFYNIAKRHDSKIKRLASIAGRNKLVLDDEMEKPFFQRAVAPIFTSTIRYISNLLPKRKGDKANKVEKSLKLAGLSLDVNEFNAAKLILTGSCIGVAILIILFTAPGAPAAFLMILGALILSKMFPIYFLKFRISKRQQEVTNQLPDIMDLLSVSIEAGLSFDLALGRIGERLNGILVDELNMVLTEIQLGKPRRVALRNLIERSPVEELNTFISAVIQSEQLGIPIKNVLYTQAQQLRSRRKQKAQEKAMKAPVKMMLPLVVFVFPVLFIILLGPTVINLIEQFG